MLDQLADYVVLELIIGEHVVHYMAETCHIMLYVIPVLYFGWVTWRHRQHKQLALLHVKK